MAAPLRASRYLWLNISAKQGGGADLLSGVRRISPHVLACSQTELDEMKLMLSVCKLT